MFWAARGLQNPTELSSIENGNHSLHPRWQHSGWSGVRSLSYTVPGCSSASSFDQYVLKAKAEGGESRWVVERSCDKERVSCGDIFIMEEAWRRPRARSGVTSWSCCYEVLCWAAIYIQVDKNETLREGDWAEVKSAYITSWLENKSWGKEKRGQERKAALLSMSSLTRCVHLNPPQRIETPRVQWPWRSYRHPERSFTADSNRRFIYSTLPFSSAPLTSLLPVTYGTDGIDGQRCEMEYTNLSFHIFKIVYLLFR